jgi:hypothetical protein
MNIRTKEREAVLRVFVAMFRPLMRVALQYGIGAGEIASAIRRTYVEELEKRLTEQKLPLTDARIAITAGLPRTDVSALREAARLDAPHGSGYGEIQERIGSVLTQWNAHVDFRGAYGIPLDLDLRRRPGSTRPLFADLVEVACKGADPDTLLQALVAAGSAEVVDDLYVRHVSRTYLTTSPDVGRIEQVGRFSAAVATTFAYNLLRSESDSPYFERYVLADEPLSESGRDAFLSLVSVKGQELLSDVDSAVARLAANEHSPSGRRYGLGVFFFEDPAGDASVARTERAHGNPEPPREAPGPINETIDPNEIDVLALMSASKQKK